MKEERKEMHVHHDCAHEQQGQHEHCEHYEQHRHGECSCGHHMDDVREPENIPEGMNKKIFILDGLGCANCAAKMEHRIRQLSGVETAVLTYATKQLIVVSEHPDNLRQEIQNICNSIEEGVIVRIKDERTSGIHRDKKVTEENKKDILTVGVGMLLFIIGELTASWQPGFYIDRILFVAAYLVLGAEIVWTAGKNLVKGRVFDENFLMSIATLGAFVIGDFAEAVGVMLFYRAGELFEEIAVSRSRSQIMEAVDLRPETVWLVSGEEVREIPARDAKPGDILLIRPGDRVPLDGRVLEGRSQIDTSPVTGEPVPVSVYPGSEILSGCVNDQGLLRMEVVRPLSQSMVTRILDSVENAAASKPKIDRFITRFARIYTPAVVAAALAVAIFPSLLTGEWRHWIYTAITFLVISCPCALVLSVPLAFFSGIGAGSKRGILFKGGLAMEAMREIRAVVMDKTGTLTCGRFEVRQIVTLGKMTEKQLLALAADCESCSTHPIGVSITEAAAKRDLKLMRPSRVEEIPGKGVRAEFPEGVILCGSREFLTEAGVETQKCQNEAYGTEVLIAAEGRLEGYLIISDVMKEGASAAVKRMKEKGLITVMLTGDVPESAKAVAEKLGVDEVYARLLPQEKLEYMQKIRKTYGPVMYVGDGINDAPVLAGADVGAAMGSGADAAIEAADVVFLNPAAEAIPESIAIAGRTGKTAMQNIIFALTVKLLILVLGIFGCANMWMAVFADTGVAVLCVLNSIRILYMDHSLQKY